jgi:hypothetical protein
MKLSIVCVIKTLEKHGTSNKIFSHISTCYITAKKNETLIKMLENNLDVDDVIDALFDIGCLIGDFLRTLQL